MKPSDAYLEAQSVYDSHNPQYQENWREWEIISLADLAAAKARRVKQAILDRNWEQALEESIDVMNYESFVWCRVKDMLNLPQCKSKILRCWNCKTTMPPRELATLDERHNGDPICVTCELRRYG